MADSSVQEQSATVLLIDDDEDHLKLLSHSLSEVDDAFFDYSIEIRTFTDPAKAIACVQTLDNPIIITDYKMPGGTGVEWLADFKRAGSGPVIILTGEGDERIAATAFRHGADDYLTKTAVLEDPARLWRTIRESLRRDRLEACSSDLARELADANESLNHQNKRLAELTDTAHRFVDNVAHEFRTPLTVIREFASILQEGIGGDLNDSQLKYVNYIHRATTDLAHLVDDFLDSGRLKSRTLRVDRRAYPASAILDHTRETLRARAINKNIAIVEQIDPASGEVFVDLEKAGRTLVNLAVNAIKFSPENEQILIKCQPNSNGDVEFTVTDHGPGLAEDEIEVIFDRFQQVGDVQRSTIKGFGLGLNIARELVWLNLGTITVASQLGQGSTFGFTIPVLDPAILLERYLGNIAQLSERERVTVLHVHPDSDDVDTEAIRRWLCQHCYPTDLAIPSMDKTSVVVLGLCDEPDRWIERLDRIRSNERSSSHQLQREPGGQCTIDWVGSWKFPQQEDAITAAALGRAMNMSACA